MRAGGVDDASDRPALDVADSASFFQSAMQMTVHEDRIGAALTNDQLDIDDLGQCFAPGMINSCLE